MAFCRLDKIGANAHVVSFRHAQELENGMIVELDKLGADKDSYTAKDVANVDGKVVLHASVAFDYTETMGSVDFEYRLKPGQLGRGYFLVSGDIITVDEAVLSASDTIAVGDVFEPKAGRKLTKVEDVRASKLGLEVVDLETIMGTKCVVLQVL